MCLAQLQLKHSKVMFLGHPLRFIVSHALFPVVFVFSSDLPSKCSIVKNLESFSPQQPSSEAENSEFVCSDGDH